MWFPGGDFDQWRFWAIVILHVSRWVSLLAHFQLKLGRVAPRNMQKTSWLPSTIRPTFITEQKPSWSLQLITFASMVKSFAPADQLVQRAQSHYTAVIALSLVILSVLLLVKVNQSSLQEPRDRKNKFFKWALGEIVKGPLLLPSLHSQTHLFYLLETSIVS